MSDRILLADTIESQLEALGTKGLGEITSFLDAKIIDSDGWQKNIYVMIANAVSAYGIIGVNMALNALHDILEGEPSNLDWADLEVASDLLAALQNQEADIRDATRAFLVQLGSILRDIATGIIMNMM